MNWCRYMNLKVSFPKQTKKKKSQSKKKKNLMKMPFEAGGLFLAICTVSIRQKRSYILNQAEQN